MRKVKIIGLLLLCSLPVLPAWGVDTSIADDHFQLGKWQQAENEYMVLYENSQKLGDTYTQVDLHKKFDTLYKKSGWSPLHYHVKAGVVALNPPPPKPSLLEQLGWAAGPSYPAVYGKVADYLIKYTKQRFDQDCRTSIPGYMGSTEYTGFVFALPNGNYSVMSSCKASMTDGSDHYDADLTVTFEIYFKSAHDEPKILARSTSVIRIESDAPKGRKKDSFDDYSKRVKDEGETRRIENAKAAENATREANQREAQALQQLRDRERAAEGSSYMSRYNSR